MCQAESSDFILGTMGSQWRVQENGMARFALLCWKDGSEIQMREGKEISDK